MVIDTAFNFTSDTPSGGDPDKASPTLHTFHQVLWGRPLPNGNGFRLEDVRGQGRYLHHRSDGGRDVWLRSDAVIPTYTNWKRQGVMRIMANIPKEDRIEFDGLSYTIGGMMVFPHNPTNRLWTLNQARGCLAKIADRMDLTLECIRRYYRDDGQDNPLEDVLNRYGDFFKLFETFDGYVEHFLLQDLVTNDGTVNFFLSPGNFQRPAIPQDVEEWKVFRDRSVQFVRARNERIKQLAL